MKLRLFSDLHWEFGHGWRPTELPEDKETILILAGDLNNGGRCVANLLALHQRFRYVLFVLGNHDYYGHNLNSVAAEITQLLRDAGADNVVLLNRTSITIDDTVFIGATLWADMNKDDWFVRQSTDDTWSDYKEISVGDRQMNAMDFISEHEKDLTFIKTSVADNNGQKIVIITHHAPSEQSSPARFTGQLLNHMYYTELGQWIAYQDIALWCHGHMHDQADYIINECRVRCNPVGYRRAGYPEFDEVGTLVV